MATGYTNVGGSKPLSGSALPSDVRMGQTFSSDGKNLQTGTLNLTNLLPENICEGVTIAGEVGVLRSVDSLKDAPLVSVIDLKAPVGAVGSYTVPDGIKYILAIIVGAGGEGGAGGNGKNASLTSGKNGTKGEPSWFIDEKYYASGGKGGYGGSGAPKYDTTSTSGSAGQGGNLLIKIFVVSPNEVLPFYLGRGGGNTTNPIPDPNHPNNSRSCQFFNSLTGPTNGVDEPNLNINQNRVSKGGSGGAGLFSVHPNPGNYGSTGKWSTSYCMFGGSGGEGQAGGGAGGGGNLCYAINSSEDPNGYGFGGSGGRGGSGGIRLYLYG